MGFILGTSSSLSSSVMLTKKKKKSPMQMASLRKERTQEESISSHRRSFLFVGISVLPLLHLKPIAAEDPSKAFSVVSQTRGVATVFLSLRNRNKDRKVKTFALPQAPTSEVQPTRKKKKKIWKGLEVSKPSISRQYLSLDQNKINKMDKSSASKTSDVHLITMPEKKDTGRRGEQESELILEKKDTGMQEKQEPQLSELEMSSLEPSQFEKVLVQEAHGNSIFSLLNVFGIIASGVLAALYATSRKEKTAMESTIESMEMKLSEKDAAAASLKENFDKILLKEQEDRKKQIIKLEEEKASLSSKISSAKGTIAALGRELQNEKELVKVLKSQIRQLDSVIIQVGESKNQLEAKLKESTDTIIVLQDRASLLTLEIDDKEKNIQNLKSLLADKESEVKKLNFVIDKTRIDLSEAHSTIELLEQELLKTRKEAHSKEASIDLLNAEIESVKAEKDEINKKFCDLTKEYDDLKSASDRRRALDSELLSKKDDQLHLLEEKLGLSLSKISNNQTTIAELMKARDDAKSLMERELNNIKKLKNELQTTKEALEASKFEAANLGKELKDIKISYEELMSKSLLLQDEFQSANKLLNSNLEEAKSTSKAFSDELASIKEALMRTKEELGIASNELNTVMKDKESSKRELLEIYSKLESKTQELKEERTIVATLNRELEVLGKQMLKDSEARRALESDLDVATESLDEMNKSALLLSRELENTNSKAASLEAEKEMLLHSVIEQKNIAKEAEENIVDAQNLITRLESGRDSLEKRTKKLEEELASAKGEVLRLRRQISMSEESVDLQHQKANEDADGTPFSVKKTVSRRRKGNSSSEVL